MKASDWLAAATKQLAQAGIGTARLDCLVLLEDVAGKERAWLLAHPEFELSSADTALLQKLLNRRMTHEPLAYIRGKTEFYGRTFVLTPHVLEPRPETETMIELLKALIEPGNLELQNNNLEPHAIRIADVGTGSGALGITAALELKCTSVDLIDIDEKALATARTNVELFTLGLPVIKSDLLLHTAQNYDVLLCNLPYVPDTHTINAAALHEPRIAIFGGPDGLDLYRSLYKQIMNIQKRPLFILTESLPPQHEDLCAIAESHGYKQLKAADFIQVFTPITTQ